MTKHYWRYTYCCEGFIEWWNTYVGRTDTHWYPLVSFFQLPPQEKKDWWGTYNAGGEL